MKLMIPTAVTTRVARQILLAQKHSPTILFGAGVIGVVATTVSACRATLKVESVLDGHQHMAEVIRETEHVDYSDQDRKKDMLVLYTRTAGEFTKLYGPSLILGALSIAALTQSHRILSSRNAALTAAYAAVDKAFKEYRGRVISELGEDKDKEFRYGVETVTVKTEDTNGPKKTKVKVAGEGRTSMYARLFNESNPNWSSTPEYNTMFLRSQTNYANDKLQRQGHFMLNDMLDALGLDRTPAGTQVGWLRDGDGDGYIDLGIWDDKSMQRFHAFATGLENEIVLDFNVDGVIWDKI